MIIPSVLNIGDNQSGKATRTGTVSNGASTGGAARDERMQASKKNHQPIVNCTIKGECKNSVGQGIESKAIRPSSYWPCVVSAMHDEQ